MIFFALISSVLFATFHFYFILREPFFKEACFSLLFLRHRVVEQGGTSSLPSNGSCMAGHQKTRKDWGKEGRASVYDLQLFSVYYLLLKGYNLRNFSYARSHFFFSLFGL